MHPSKQNQISYALKVTELMLLYCYSKRKKANFDYLLNHECDILRKTSLYNLKKKRVLKSNLIKWKKISKEIESYSHLTKKSFIHECIKILKPFLIKRVNKNQSLVEYNTKAKFGCFDFSILDKKIDLHMPVFRFIDPQMISSKKFSKKEKLYLRAEDLYKLLSFAKRKHPSVNIVQMGSWMNQFSPFRVLFPKDWKPNGKEKKKNSIAWWGQFLKSDGNINKQLYSKFKKNLNFKFKGKFYQCHRDKILEHLEKLND